MLSCQASAFSLPRDIHYLNCAYMAPLPKAVEQAGVAGLRRKRTPAEIAPNDFFDDLEMVRQRFAALINADRPDQIAVIPSASYGLATAARNLRVERGQNVVLLAAQFPSNVYVWRRLVDGAGAVIRTVTAPDGAEGRGEAWNARLLDAIDGDTAVVAIGQAHWTDGTVFDLSSVASRAREVGAALVVDGTQSVGAMPFDVQDIRPDALICAAYKWLLGPYSIGVAYYGPRFEGGEPLEETWIGREGSHEFARLVDYQDAYRAGALRYDAGESSNFILLPMLRAALEQLHAWGVPNISAYCAVLTDALAAGVVGVGFGVESGPWRAPHILGLRMPAALEPEAVRSTLAARRIHVSVRGDVLRVSPHLYNDSSNVEALVEALAEVSRVSRAP
jgi:selenocysteine lyase/cysteine desulfurase